MTVIGLYGAAGVGKTTVASLLSKELGWRVRHCGELIKRRSKELGCTSEDLPNLEHSRMDEETRSIVGNPVTDLIVEGRFLDFVLLSVPHVILVCLICSFGERTRRYSLRARGDSLGSRDASDLHLRHELYGTADAREPDLQIDTSCTTALNVAARIKMWLQDRQR